MQDFATALDKKVLAEGLKLRDASFFQFLEGMLFGDFVEQGFEPGDVLLKDLEDGFPNPVVAEGHPRLKLPHAALADPGVDRLLEHGDARFPPEPPTEENR